jgi:hypothetical protein
VCKALNDDASAFDVGTSEGCGGAAFGIAGWAGWWLAIRFCTAVCACIGCWTGETWTGRIAWSAEPRRRVAASCRRLRVVLDLLVRERRHVRQALPAPAR